MTFGYNLSIPKEKEQLPSMSGNGGLMNSAWPMFQRDIGHTGQSSYGKPGDGRVLKWKTNIGSMVYSSPAIDKDGTIYIGSNNWNFYAINSDGTEKWRFKTGGGVSSSPAIADDGTIYVGSEDGYLYAIYPNGTKKWNLEIGHSWVYSSPVIDENGIVYIGSVGGNNICAVYPNGTKKWDTKIGGMVYCSPGLDNNGIVYCGANDGYMYAIYRNNGTLKWKYRTNEKIGSAPTIDDSGAVYFGSNDGYLYALYSNGTLKWRFLTKKFYGLVSSPAIAEDGSIIVGSGLGYVYSINPNNGTENWRFSAGADVSASPGIDKFGVIYVGAWNGMFYALNPDGTLKWRYKTLDEIIPSSAIGEDGTIYVAADSVTFQAYLYAIEPIDDNPPETPDLDGPDSGEINVDYTYTAETIDPDDDNVSYFFNWGDGSSSGWTEFVPSGESVTRRHRWKQSDTYTIKVKAIDEYGMESDWEILIVTMPRSRATYNSLFFNILERFPILRGILSLLINC